MHTFFAVLLSLTLIHCSSKPKTETVVAAAPPPEAADLQWSEAKDRKARLENVRYEVTIALNAKDETFTGTDTIRFQLKTAGQPLRLDFYEGSVSALKVNGKTVDPTTAKKKYWILLPGADLIEGENTVEVSYTSAFTRQGIGLHRFVDPETKDTFIYSKLEPYEANRVFPMFDQPDLRASLQLNVQVPAKWKVISTTQESAVKKGADGVSTWTFPPTPAIATYLFSLHAGPYQVFQDKFEDIPLRIYARPSMAKYVRAKEWFGWTKKGLKYYNTYFNLKYPFKKYDQIFVPEAGGAMENVASVTFTENILSRSEPTRQQQRAANNVLLHEMAHMWFGDIVTMAWWNDLWLNESFATYMAALAQHSTTDFKEAWQKFYTGEKQWAYWEDGLVTTHPIEAPVTSIKEAFANFDGITYGKGASVVKQLRYYIGAENFDKGIRDYMKKHAYGNTELKDFIAALQTHTKKDLTQWANLWLRQSGADKLQAKWTCDGAVLTSMELVTTPTEGMKFRPQKVEIAFYYDSLKVKPVVVPADLTQSMVTIKGSWACPSFVYPNSGDHGYTNVSLDQKSLDFTRRALSKIDSALLRNQLWGDLWEMVRTGELPLKDYVAIVDEHFVKEKDQLVADTITTTISGSESRSILNYWAQTTADAKAKREAFIARMEKEYLNRLNTAKPGSDDQKFWLDEYSRLARTEAGLEQVKNWLNGTAKLKGLPLDLDRRWTMTRQLARFKPADAGPFIEALKKEDASDRGRRNGIATEVIQPNPETKQKWMTTLQLPKTDLSLAESRTAMNFLFPPEQAELSKPFDAAILNYLRANARTENESYLRIVAQRLSPLSCEPARAETFKRFISGTQWTMAISKPLRVNLQEDERCQVVRSKSQMN